MSIGNGAASVASPTQPQLSGGLYLKGTVIAVRTEEKEWEKDKYIQTTAEISDGQQVYSMRHRHSPSALVDERLTAFLRHIAAGGEAQQAAEAALVKLTERGLETPALVIKDLDDSLATAKKALIRASQIHVSLTVRVQLLMMMDERVKAELKKVLSNVTEELETAKKKQKELAQRSAALRRCAPSDGLVI